MTCEDKERFSLRRWTYAELYVKPACRLDDHDNSLQISLCVVCRRMRTIFCGMDKVFSVKLFQTYVMRWDILPEHFWKQLNRIPNFIIKNWFPAMQQNWHKGKLFVTKQSKQKLTAVQYVKAYERILNDSLLKESWLAVGTVSSTSCTVSPC